MNVHPTAIVHQGARLGPDVEVGPYAVIEDLVTIGTGTRIMAGAHVKSYTTMGSHNVLHTGAVIGDIPQDRDFGGGETYVRIGDHNVFREHATVHRGTLPGTATEIGNYNTFMVNAHVAHNCTVGNHVVLVNNSALGGYVAVDDHATLSGGTLVHQFCRVGRYAFLRGGTRTARDAPPFCIVEELHTVRSLNVVGLQRAGFSDERIRNLKRCFSLLFRSGKNMAQAMQRVEEQMELTEDVRHLLDFIKTSKRGVAVSR